MCIGIWPVCLCERVASTVVTDSCELSCRSWGWNPSPLEKELMFLTIEPSFQLEGTIFYDYISLSRYTAWEKKQAGEECPQEE